MNIDWSQFPPPDPPASPLEVSKIVALSTDRHAIYSLGFPLSLLLERRMWTPDRIALLSDRGKAELEMWLTINSPPPSKDSTPRKTKQKLPCSQCHKNPAGYPGALHSIFCSDRCRKRRRNQRYITLPVVSVQSKDPPASVFGPIHHPSPVPFPSVEPLFTSATQLTFESSLQTIGPTLPQSDLQSLSNSNGSSSETDSPDHFQDANPPLASGSTAVNVEAIKNALSSLTVSQLKSLQSMERVFCPGKSPLKDDRIIVLTAHYSRKSWEQLKNDMAATGVDISKMN
jgi:hypothetical protein